MTKAEANASFLRNIYNKGPFEGHAFVCRPPRRAIFEGELGDYTISERPVADWVPQIVEDYELQIEYLETLGDHIVPMASLECATHLYAAAFGCPVHRYENNLPCALPVVRSAAEADTLEEPDIWNSPTLYRIFELAEELIRELGPDVYLGPPDLQSGFDTACSVWQKEELLRAMLEEPDAVKRLAAKCANLLRTFLIELRKEFPTLAPGHCPRAWAPPEMGFWVSIDECGSFSTDLFEAFCLPELTELSEAFGGLGIHCCADAEHQFESFKKIPNFYAFNRVAAAKGWDPLLEHFDGPDAPVHVLGWLPASDVEHFIRVSSPQTRFIFVHLSEAMDDAREWLDQVRMIAPRVQVT